jgi:O-acetyl-ADP-ribose deacetylase (regulator of RNase III)
MLTVHLRDRSGQVVAAWETAFSDAPRVHVSCGDIFDHEADAVVSPANSFGYMDGGIDLVYSWFFGRELETNLRALLREHHYGELPVGQAVVLSTGHKSIPFLVSAPTMRVAGSINGTVNIYLAFRAALIAVLSHNKSARSPIGSLLVPGLGTGVGEVPPPRAARQMRLAIGALIPWADRLWAVGYVAHIKGSGIGLYEIDRDMSMNRRAESVTGTFANRLVHWDSAQAFIGPHAIDAKGNVRTVEALKAHRLAATMRHLEDPRHKVYFLTMEGLFFEVDVQTFKARQLFDLVKELKITGGQPHFKSAHTAQ